MGLCASTHIKLNDNNNNRTEPLTEKEIANAIFESKQNKQNEMDKWKSSFIQYCNSEYTILCKIDLTKSILEHIKKNPDKKSFVLNTTRIRQYFIYNDLYCKQGPKIPTEFFENTYRLIVCNEYQNYIKSNGHAINISMTKSMDNDSIEYIYINAEL